SGHRRAQPRSALRCAARSAVSRCKWPRWCRTTAYMIMASGSGGEEPAPRDDGPVSQLATPPWRWIAAAVVVVCALLYATLSRYGYHRDELYFRMLPTRWGYVDQPFLTPLLAKVSIHLFGDTVFGLRAL